MKIFIRLRRHAVILLLLIISSAHAQVYSSYYQGRKVVYKASTTQILVKFKGVANLDKHNKLLSIFGIINTRFNKGMPDVAFVDVVASHQQEILSALATDADVLQAYPVLLNDAGQPFGGITDQFIVHLKPEVTILQLQKLLGQTGASIHHRYEFDELTYILTINKAKGNALELANRFYETGLFTFAEPNFLLFIKTETNDQLFNQQYALRNTGQNGGAFGADIRAEGAWSQTTGVSTVRIAIVDNGVQLNHPDLINNLLPGFDATGQGTNGGIFDSNDAHGTDCAGIAAAQGDNTIGIAGVAYSCRIVPVRILAGIYGGATFSEWAAAGIDWARQNNRADVISCSWRTASGTNIINQAIHNAITLGRNGLGCLVVVASGNDSANNPAFPSSNPETLCVGATTNTDHRASFSNYGTGLDVVAPGQDVMATAIGNAPNGNYENFTGTSAAAPVVSGIAALVYSINSSLTQAQARQCIESSADQINLYSYSYNSGENPTLPWNNEVGYGRVNACNAVMRARNFSTQIVSSSGNTFCSSSTFSIQGLSVNPQSINWTSSSNDILTINSSGQANVEGTGQAIVTANVIFPGSCRALRFVLAVQVTNPYVNGRYLVPNTSTQGTLVPFPQDANYVDDTHVTVVVPRQSVPYEPASYSFSLQQPSAWQIYQDPNYPRVFQLYQVNTSNPSAGAYVDITKTTSCGTVTQTFAFVNASAYSYSVSPNPTSDEVTVQTVQNTSSSFSRRSDALPFEAELYNSFGKKVKAQKSIQGTSVLDVRGLPTGVYTLRVGQGKKGFSKQIQIAH